MHELIGTRDCVAIIGPAKSTTTEDVASWLLHKPTKNRTVIGYSATSTDLSADKYTNFLRTSPADAVVARGMADLMYRKLVFGLVWVVPEGDFNSSG